MPSTINFLRENRELIVKFVAYSRPIFKINNGVSWKFHAVVGNRWAYVPADIVDVRPLNRAVIQDSMPVIHGAGTCERLMLSYANGMRFELPTLGGEEKYRHIMRIYFAYCTPYARMQVKIAGVDCRVDCYEKSP